MSKTPLFVGFVRAIKQLRVISKKYFYIIATILR